MTVNMTQEPKRWKEVKETSWARRDNAREYIVKNGNIASDVQPFKMENFANNRKKY